MLLILNFQNFAASTHILCNYTDIYSVHLGYSYACRIQNTISITSPEEAVITSISGEHINGRTNDDVHGVYFYGKIVHYFAQGLEKFFKNLKLIIIGYGGMRQLTQKDLINYPNIEILALYYNEIEVLDEGIFENTPRLAFINLDNNKIAKVHPEVFDNLNDLRSLFLSYNVCINMKADNNVTAVQNIIQTVRSYCPSPGSTTSTTSLYTTSTTTFLATTTTAPGNNECPEGCSSQINELNEKAKNIEKRLEIFMDETSIRLHKIETTLFGKIKNLEDKLDKMIRTIKNEV